MKNLFTAFCIAATIYAGAQTTATNFTCNDCQGNSHDLFTELDTGCVVVIDWVMPCNTCIPPSVTAYNIVQSYQSTYPGRVKFYVVDDYANTTCVSLTNWTITNNMPGTTTFSNASISMTDYGTAGMPKIVVLGGEYHKVYYNQNGTGSSTLLQEAIDSALGETGFHENGVNANSLKAYPVPAGNSLSLNFTSEVNGDAIVNIYGVDGKLVRPGEQKTVAQGNNTIEISTAELAAGMYSIEVIVGDRVIRTSFVIE